MNPNELGRIFDRANESFERAQLTGQKVDRSIDRANQVMRRADERDGTVRAAAQRERQRLNADLKRRLSRVGIWIGLMSLATIVIGLIIPIGMFGFLAAVGLAIGIAAVLAFMPSADRTAAAPATDLPNGEMVQRFDSYLYRSRAMLPPPAQAEVDALSAVLPSLKQTLERVDPLDRLIAFGRARLATASAHLDILLEAEDTGPQRFTHPTRTVVVMHTRMLLTQMGFRGNLEVMCMAVLAPLEAPSIHHMRTNDRMSVDEIGDHLENLVRALRPPP